MSGTNSFQQEAAALDRQLDYIADHMAKMDAQMINPQEFGQIKAEMAAQRRDLDNMARALDKLVVSVQSMRDTMTEARGGWRAIMLIGGVAATLGGAVSWLLQHVKFG